MQDLPEWAKKFNANDEPYLSEQKQNCMLMQKLLT
jgi:hypothetical protein